MKEKELKVTPPEGYEIDRENSTFECIKFKFIRRKLLTYEEICDEVIQKGSYYITNWGNVAHLSVKDVYGKLTDKGNGSSKEQLEKVLAINQLFNISRYYNGDWKPNWTDNSNKYLIYYDNASHIYNICLSTVSNHGWVYFKNEEDAQAVINNPNFREILNTIFK